MFLSTAKCFLSETDKMMAELELAVESGNLKRVRERAHCVKGGLVYLHAQPSAEAARALQQAAEQESESVECAFHKLKEEVETLKKALSTKGLSSNSER